MNDNSLLIIGHRFPRHLKRLERNGKFNLAFQLYRNNVAGHECLQHWREQCIDWCYDKVEKNRYADQKYLNTWPEEFNAVVSQNKGADLAPWNWMQYDMKMTNGKLMVDEDELIFFHFQGFRFLNNRRIYHSLGTFFAVMPKELRDFLYGNYAKELLKMESVLRECCKEFNPRLQFLNKRTSWATYMKSIVGFPFNTMRI